MSNTNTAAKNIPAIAETIARKRSVRVSRSRADIELDIALERSANAKGIERAVIWWRAAGL